MNERIRELALEAKQYAMNQLDETGELHKYYDVYFEKFAELIVKEMCDMMEQAEDDSYHCFEPSERPMDYIRFLYDWRTRFEKHFGDEE
jgi:hypothetical protein